MAYSVELWSQLRSTMGTVLRYPNVGVHLDHSREVRTCLSHHTNFPSCAFTLQGKTNKRHADARLPVEFRRHSGVFSMFALQVKTAILGLQCYQQTLPRQQKKMGKLQSCVGLQALCVPLLISRQTWPFCDDNIMHRTINYSHK